MRKLLVVASIVALIALGGGPSHAGVQEIIALPGATVAGVYDAPNYGGANSVATRSAPVVFVNLDPLGPHNIQSDANKPGTTTPWFRSGNPVGAGASQQMNLSTVPPGTYAFHCSAHQNMHGTLMLLA